MGTVTTLVPFFLVPLQPQPFLVLGQPPSFLMFIIPHTTRMKTRVCTRRPRVEGHPVGVAIQEPRTRLTRRKVSGLATMKNVKPEMTEIINFSSCFLPLHPQPQSLKRPMISFDICQQKNRLKVKPPSIDITNQQCRSLFSNLPNSPLPPCSSRNFAKTRMAVKPSISTPATTRSSTSSSPSCAPPMV